MREEKPRVIAIIGPTATGKSHCGIALARKLGGEIISGDSMLVFRHMDIATAKPTAEELALVPHHLVDILEPDAKFSVVDFQQQADRLIREINSRGKIPILVGGTGLYVKALLEAYDFPTWTNPQPCAGSWKSSPTGKGTRPSMTDWRPWIR